MIINVLKFEKTLKMILVFRVFCLILIHGSDSLLSGAKTFRMVYIISKASTDWLYF